MVAGPLVAIFTPSKKTLAIADASLTLLSLKRNQKYFYIFLTNFVTAAVLCFSSL